MQVRLGECLGALGGVILPLLGRLVTSFFRSWDGFWPHFGALGASWGTLLAQVGPSWPKMAKKTRFFELHFRIWDPSWDPKSKKIDVENENLFKMRF